MPPADPAAGTPGFRVSPSPRGSEYFEGSRSARLKSPFPESPDKGTPTVAQSFVFANNKGGVGKSTILFNLVTEYAKRHPEVNVLVIDLSLYSDSSTLLLGGTRKEDGIQRGRLMMQRIPPRCKASGLIGALLQFAREKRLKSSWWPNRQWFRKHSFDFAKHTIPLQDPRFHPTAPPNLFLSAGGPDLREAIGTENWEDACYALRQSMTASLLDPKDPRGEKGGVMGLRQWVIFFDTDHEIHTPYATLALGCAERMILPLSLDENDYDRLFVGEIALFPILEEMQHHGTLRAKIDRLVFNRMLPHQNAPYVDEGTGGRLPFTPVQSEFAQMKSIAKDLHGRYLQGMHTLFLDADNVGTSFNRFMQRYVTALRLAAPTTINFSKMRGIALSQLDDSNIDTGKVSKATLQPLKKNLGEIADGLESRESVL